MTATHGAWLPVGTNTIDTEVIRYRKLSVNDPRDLFPLHAVMLRTGKVLWFSGHAEHNHYAEASWVFDPTDSTLRRAAFPSTVDFFCCHYVQLPDGNILAVGGSQHDFATVSSRGSKTVAIFEPSGASGAWRPTGHELLQGRWYPTAVLLGDGRVLVFSGRREPGVSNAFANIADWVEVLRPPDYIPEHLTVGPTEVPLPLYPGLHLAPDGRVYYTHTNWGQEIDEPTTRALRVTGPTSGAWDDFGFQPDQPRREEGMSVLLPPAQDGKILLVGGSEARDVNGDPMVRTRLAFDHIADAGDGRRAEILTTGATPAWTDAPGGGNTRRPRINGHLVLLPDATVLVCGGHNRYKRGAGTVPSNTAEIFTPGVGFTEVAAMTQSRMYHSTALLLPDGRVLVAGGELSILPTDREETLPWPAGWPADIQWAAGDVPLNQKTHQIYRPPYLFKGAQPTIDRVARNGARTSQIPYGSTFTVDSPQASTIDKVALMRPGAPTHHTDSEQRYVALTCTKTSTQLTVTMLPDTPASRNLAPPGYYMLWIVTASGVPCARAKFVHVVAAGTPEPPPEPEPPPPPAPASGCCLGTLVIAATGALLGARVLLRATGGRRAR